MPGVGLPPRRSLEARIPGGSKHVLRIVITEMTTVRRKAWIGVLTVALLLLAAGCGAGEGRGDYGGEHPDYEKALAGAPPALAAVHRQGNELLGGGRDAFERRIEALRGYP